VLAIEADAVRALISRLDERFLAAVSLILACKGRVIVSGIGKSGHVARKIASTLSSTGTPAHFVHPAEASHGDLGMITRGDVFIALSNSGESAELVEILPVVKRIGAKMIAITGKAGSTLAREADVSLTPRFAEEACPHNLAPRRAPRPRSRSAMRLRSRCWMRVDSQPQISPPIIRAARCPSRRSRTRRYCT
jgi:arabinose-5-phosphate isomerase